MTAPESHRCDRCTSPAKFRVSSVLTSEIKACPVHLADRVSYVLGQAVRVDVRKLEVLA